MVRLFRPFVSGPLTADEAADLNELARLLACLLDLRASPPLSFRIDGSAAFLSLTDMPDVRLAQVTASAANADGTFPAVTRRYDEAGAAWGDELLGISVRFPDGTEPDSGTECVAFFSGHNADGTGPVYVSVLFNGGTVTGDVTFTHQVTVAGPSSVLNLGTPASGTNLPAPVWNVWQNLTQLVQPGVTYLIQATTGGGSPTLTNVLQVTVNGSGVVTGVSLGGPSFPLTLCGIWLCPSLPTITLPDSATSLIQTTIGTPVLTVTTDGGGNPTSLIVGGSSGPPVQIPTSVIKPVLVATAAPLPTYTGGGTGTLTATGNGQLTVDGVPLNAGDVIAVISETGGSAVNNGLWTVTQPGSAGTPWILTLSPLMETGTQVVGAVITVATGTVNGGSILVTTNATPPTIGTTPITTSLAQADAAQIGGVPVDFSTPPTSGQTITIDPVTGDFKPATAGGGAALDPPYTGTTTSAYVQVFDKTNANGLHGVFSLVNTGANGLVMKVTGVDVFGNTGVTGPTVVSAGQAQTVDLYSQQGPGGPTAYPPLTEIKLEIKDQTGGSHTTYQVYMSLVG